MEEDGVKKLAPVSKSVTQEMGATSKADIINNGNDSLLSFNKSKNEIDLLNVDKSSVVPISAVNTNPVDKKNENNDNKPNIYETKKDDFENVNVEEMDKIQKDILKILKRLENHDDQM